MDRLGFDNDKYLTTQSEMIKKRIAEFGGKLYLEFGGKLFDDYHASRVLPGFQPDSKIRMLKELADYTKLLPDKYVPFIRISDSGKVRKVTFHIGKDNYKALDEIFEISDNPILSGLAPQIDKPYSKSEYVDLLQYVFEDYLEKGESAQKILDKSYVQLNIKTSGKVLSSDKGSFKGNSLWIKLPLVDFLTLEKTVEFSFSYSI